MQIADLTVRKNHPKGALSSRTSVLAPGASQPDRIRQALMNDLETGVLTPGLPLDEKALAERFGVSRTPVREALLTLAAQHLITIQPRSGMYVHSPQASELVSMLEALSELEAVVVRLCTLRMDQAQRDRLQALCRLTDEAAQRSARLAFEEANQQFHDALYEGCGNGIVVEQVHQLRLRLSAFRRRLRDQPGRLQSSAADHRAIVDGMLANDPERAAQAMREHISAKGRAFADLLLAPPFGR
jgi:DNA-binding GntR family transcriptional regulator